MPIFVSLMILVFVVLFILLAFAISVVLASRALRERETEWPANWNAPIQEIGPGGIPEGVVHDEREAEAGAGAHRVA